MALSNLSLEQLKQMIPLLKEKEALQAKLYNVCRRLERLEQSGVSDKVAHSTAINKLKKRPRRQKKIKQAILKALQAAGAQGLTLKELAINARVHKPTLNTWIYTTGKKTPGIKKIAPGTFAYVS
jgi:hypothetical protein